MGNKIIFYLPRLLSVIISIIVFLFLSEALVTIPQNQLIFSLIIGITVILILFYLILWQKKIRLIPLLPTGVWFYLILYGLNRGMIDSLNLIQYLFLTLIVSVPMWISFYAWQNNKIGGTLYLVLAMLYLFIAYGKIETGPLLIVLIILVTQGIGFILTTPAKYFSNQPEQDEQVHPTNRSGWESLL